MSREPIKVLADILQAELGLPAGQIMLENQKWNIPQGTGLYIALSYVSGKPIANNNYFDGDAVQEVQETVWNYLVQIDLMSTADEDLKSRGARARKEEVVTALRSMTSQAFQEANLLQIGAIPLAGFVNAGSLEETARLNRYTMTISMTALFRKVKATPDYEVFPNQEVHYA